MCCLMLNFMSNICCCWIFVLKNVLWIAKNTLRMVSLDSWRGQQENRLCEAKQRNIWFDIMKPYSLSNLTRSLDITLSLMLFKLEQTSSIISLLVMESFLLEVDVYFIRKTQPTLYSQVQQSTYWQPNDIHSKTTQWPGIKSMPF